jgi:DNA-binding response OmpR family regulator
MDMHAHGLTMPVGSANWRADMAAWGRDFRALLARQWSGEEAHAMFERIEAFSALAELIADRDVADATAELEVYLCAFVDSDLRPDGAQRARLERLVGELEGHLQGGGAPVAAVPAAEERAASHTHGVYYLRTPGGENARLVEMLRERGVEVRMLDNVSTAIAALEHELPDAFLLDAAFLPDVQKLNQSGRRPGAGTWRKVLWAAAGLPDDLRARLHARRAGIDLLLDGEAAKSAEALLGALSRRREEAYRVLVVEDDRGHAAFCESLLRHQGFEVDVAGSAEDALDLMQARAPDLILLDINLPDMTGIELAQLVRERESLAHVPVVFLTGEEDLDRRAEAIAAGGDDFLSKPVRPRHLLANVNSRIGRARALALSAPAERPEGGLTLRLDRVRFVEAMEDARRGGGTAAVAVFAMNDIANVAAKLGFVRAGNLALEIAQAIEARCGGLGRTCGIGEFSRLVLLRADNEAGLRGDAEALRYDLDHREWLSAEGAPIGFSVGLARFEGSGVDVDRVIADAIGAADAARRAGTGQVGFLDLR